MVSALGAYGQTASPKPKTKKPRQNGGKYSFDDYPLAPTTIHDVEGCSVGERCEACGLGRYYSSEDRRQLTFMSGPIVTVHRHIHKTLRCNQCGHEQRKHVQHRKWTPEARSGIIIQKLYGMPWYRMSRLQQLYGLPIAVSTFWEQARVVWEDSGQYIAGCLQYYAANSTHIQSDDTGNKILSVMSDNRDLPAKETRACHTTGICATYGDIKLHVYVTTDQYCRENVEDLLQKRTSTEKVISTTDASPQSIMSDQSSTPVEQTLCLGNHARKKFKDLESSYPEICYYFLTLIKFLYKNDDACKDKTAEERLCYHQEHSKPIINAIYAKIDELFEKRLVEPNSDLGGAMKYWLNHRTGLTAFLRLAGVPLDTNWVERALRLVVVYRKNSLFFKTKQSALILNDLLSIVSTCEANGINAFAYLNWIQLHWKEVQAKPEAYLPWCFKQKTEPIAA